jgi:hypothetical protein
MFGYDTSFSGKIRPVNSIESVEPPPPPSEASGAKPMDAAPPRTLPAELPGRGGPDPTRYGDWELRGRCIDF